jgi:hypothetical protein
MRYSEQQRQVMTKIWRDRVVKAMTDKRLQPMFVDQMPLDWNDGRKPLAIRRSKRKKKECISSQLRIGSVQNQASECAVEATRFYTPSLARAHALMLMEQVADRLDLRGDLNGQSHRSSGSICKNRCYLKTRRVPQALAPLRG